MRWVQVAELVPALDSALDLPFDRCTGRSRDRPVQRQRSSVQARSRRRLATRSKHDGSKFRSKEFVRISISYTYIYILIHIVNKHTVVVGISDRLSLDSWRLKAQSKAQGSRRLRARVLGTAGRGDRGTRHETREGERGLPSRPGALAPAATLLTRLGHTHVQSSKRTGHQVPPNAHLLSLSLLTVLAFGGSLMPAGPPPCTGRTLTWPTSGRRASQGRSTRGGRQTRPTRDTRAPHRSSRCRSPPRRGRGRSCRPG